MHTAPRPRFERFTSLDLELVLERIRLAIKQSSGGLTGEVLSTHAQVMISGEKQHKWSPCMTLSFVEVEDSDRAESLRIRGLFGPRPSIWTFIATLYAFGAFVMFAGLVMGWSQWSIGRSPSGFYGILVGAAIIATLYMVSLSGQALAHDEMHELRDLLDRALVEEEESSVASLSD